MVRDIETKTISRCEGKNCECLCVKPKRNRFGKYRETSEKVYRSEKEFGACSASVEGRRFMRGKRLKWSYHHRYRRTHELGKRIHTDGVRLAVSASRALMKAFERR